MKRFFHPGRSPLLALVLVALLASITLPVSNTLWSEVLTISGSISTGNWATDTPTPTEPPPEPVCTRSQGYWKTHPERWPVGALTIGGVLYSQEELLDWLWSPTRGDATIILVHQYIAALLNVLNGADASSISEALTEADIFLSDFLPGEGTPNRDEHNRGVGLAKVLNDFNTGKVGPGHCKDDDSPTEPASLFIELEDPTETPTPTPTLTPTETPTETEEVDAPVSGENAPEDTPTPTATPTATEEVTQGDGLPVESSPEPTATDTLEPTPTETLEPTATDTPEPLPTDTPEPEPTETSEPVATEVTESTEG